MRTFAEQRKVLRKWFGLNYQIRKDGRVFAILPTAQRTGAFIQNTLFDGKHFDYLCHVSEVLKFKLKF